MVTFGNCNNSLVSVQIVGKTTEERRVGIVKTNGYVLAPLCNNRGGDEAGKIVIGRIAASKSINVGGRIL